MIKLGAWNIRGLNDLLKQKEVRSLILVNNFSLMGVVETKVRFENLQSTISHYFPMGWSSVHNYTSGPVTRILLGWDPLKMSITHIFHSEQIRIVDVVLLDSKKNFLLLIVYGCNRSSDRRVLWSDMRAVYHGFGDRPWIQLGDFNTVRLASERLVGFDVNSSDEFNECLTDLSQDDLLSKGFWFTWTNKRGGSGEKKSRIDRVLTNTSWMDLFPYAEAYSLAPGISDHCSISVYLGAANRKRKSFKFFNFWMQMQHPEFEHILSSSWTDLVVGRPMFVLAGKLKRLKGVLKHLNLRCYSNISTRVMEARDQMVAIQQQLFATPLMLLCVFRRRNWHVLT